MIATYVQRGEAVDFIPSRDVEAGEVLRFGDLLGVVKIPVKAGENGALHLNGIYDFDKGNEAITAGKSVFWDAATSQAGTAADGPFLGIAAAHAPAEARKVRVILNFGHPEAVSGDETPAGIQWQTTNQ